MRLTFDLAPLTLWEAAGVLLHQSRAMLAEHQRGPVGVLGDQAQCRRKRRQLKNVDSLMRTPFDLAMLRISTICVLAGLILCATDARAEGDWASSDTVITMIRGGCEKRCPVYRVVIFADGTVIIEGHHYLPKPVFVQSEISAGEVKNLVNRFLAIDYFGLPDVFGFKGRGCSSFEYNDAPSVTTTLVTGGRGKSLIHHKGCLGRVPDQLTDLEHAIDETARSSRWLKGAVPQAPH